MINLNKRLRIAFVMFNSLVAGKTDNINGPNPSNPTKYQNLESNLNNENQNSEIPSLSPSESASNTTGSAFTFTNSNNYLNLTDNSRDVFDRLNTLLLWENYTEVFEKPVEDLRHNIFASEKGESFDGSISQQSQSSHNVHQQPISSKDDTFFYSSTPDKHTSQNCYILKMKSSVEKVVFEKLSEIFGAINAKIYKKYIHGFIGYSICFPENTLPLALMKEIPSIEFVERDHVIKASQIQENAPWGLARLSSPDPKSSYYSFDGTGKGVTVYVIDSGLEKTKELGNRATLGFTAFPNEPADCAGHGTEVASLIAGTNVGVAKLANVIAVQVLDCLGDGKNSDLLDAISWVIETHQKPAIINMSLGGDRSPSIENAVKAAISAGIPVVVAAGNSNIDACTQTPAAVAEAITVAASTPKNARAKFSNFGPCVDIFAPGVDVLAATTLKRSRNGWNFASGTSFAAPLVSGVSALLLEKNPSWTPKQLFEAIKDMGAYSVLSKKTMNGSPNILLQAPSSNSKLPILVKLSDQNYLPMLGYHTSSIVTTELILVICSFIAAAIALFATGIALYRRYRKHKLIDDNSISEEELKHSILNSNRPSVFL